MEIFAQEGTPWVYPERYSFNDNIIELRDRRDFGPSCQIIVDLFINGTEVSILNGKKRYHYAFGGPIILTDKYIYIPLFEPRNKHKKNPSFWDRLTAFSGYYISRVSYSGNIEILSEKFPLVHLIKKTDNTLFFKDKYGGTLKSIEIPSE